MPSFVLPAGAVFMPALALSPPMVPRKPGHQAGCSLLVKGVPCEWTNQVGLKRAALSLIPATQELARVFSEFGKVVYANTTVDKASDDCTGTLGDDGGGAGA